MQKPLAAGFISFICVESLIQMGYMTGDALLDILLQGSIASVIFIGLLYVMDRRSLHVELGAIRASLA